MREGDKHRSSTSLRILCETAANLGVAADACLEGTGLTSHDLARTDLQPTLAQEIRAVQNVVSCSSSSVGLGVATGRQMHVNVFGAWGFAILTSPTLRAAILTAIDYIKLSFVVADMSLVEDDDKARVAFDFSDLPTEVRSYYAERHCTVTMTFIRELLQDGSLCRFSIDTRVPDPDYAARLSEILEIDVVPDAVCDALVFAQELLDLPLPKSDPVTLQYCLEQCETLVRQTPGPEQPWSQKVRDAVIENIGNEQKIESVASALSVTERTLRRRLTDEGTSFRELYTDIRLSIARELLQTAGINVETVSWRVGYAEPASFVRAFSKKYGQTPGGFKNRGPK